MAKRTNSAFIDTDLEQRLRQAGIGSLLSGRLRSADDVHAMSLADMDREHRTVRTTAAARGGAG